ncbi:serine hydrolase domain-containing protein [Gottfriedia acidiceleris]|uniref:serine hydrolase domain-containing protein n=1 Tax=Gottfriedia acidiceleris TaxID=371036 RepID=UPI000B44E387|nr:serine hydrolase domain-containing protein [Gottfriedia acidiceleris]
MQKNIELQKNKLVTKEIQLIMDKFNIVGCQAAAVLKDKLIWSDAYGFRNLETRDLVTENTMFRIASISKLFTATAIMQLVEKKLIELDNDISHYLGFKVRNPKFPNIYITLRQILTHTSSLNSDDASNSVYAKFIREGHSNFSLKLEDLVVVNGKYFTNETWGDCKPGDHWMYSNIGAIICGSIIEKVTNLRYDEYIKQNIFEPLEMKNVAFSYSNIKNIHELANLYEKNKETNEYKVTIDDVKQREYSKTHWDQYIIGNHGGLFEPQGGLRTSAVELSKFLRAHMLNGSLYGQQFLEQKTSKLMKSIQWSREESNHFFSKMGLGFHISHDFLPDYKEMIGHAGEAYGLISNLYWQEEKQFGIIFILNGSQFDLSENSRFEVEKELAEVIYKHVIEEKLLKQT